MSDDTNEPGNRDAKGRFGSGNSGNPSGRPRVPAEVKEILLAATPRAAAKLVACLEAKKSIVVGNGPTAYVDEVDDVDLQFKAANAILDRTIGKPTQPISGEDGEPLRFDVSLVQVLRKLEKEPSSE